jgi:hypothetical protein
VKGHQLRGSAADNTVAAHVGDEISDPQSVEEQGRLFSSYPLLFRSARYPREYPANLGLLGIQCGAGWYPIIETAADEIERELEMLWARQIRDTEEIAILDRLLRYGFPAGAKLLPIIPFCSSIHALAGQLAITIDYGVFCDMQSWTRIREAVQKAERRAQIVCECCGEKGAFREHWNHVYCDDCIAPEPSRYWPA